jgi:hypothetical protein
LKSDALDDEVFVLLPSDEALNHYAAKKRKDFGKALNTNDVAAIEVPLQLRNKDDKP